MREVAGAIVTIDRNGEAVIHRGLLREAEAKALRTLEKLRRGFGSTEGEAANEEHEDADDPPKAASLSDQLAQRLSAHRTAALQIEVARHPHVALAALVHGMVQKVLQDSYHGHDLPLGVSLKVQDRLEGMAPDWPESPAAVALRELQQVAGEALPEDSAELFAALLAKSQDELVRLLAVCVASTVDVVTPVPRRTSPAQNWRRPWASTWPHGGSRPQKATSSTFPAVILDAVGAFAPEFVTRLAKLKKADIASEAERLADGTGWMPAIFKAEGPQEAAQEEGRSRTPRRIPRQWRMNPPRHWPLDPRRRQAPRLDRGASLCGGASRRRNNRDQHRAQAVPPWARWTRNPGATVAAPGVQGQ